MFRQLVTNFDVFRQNNSVFMRKNRAFKKYHLWGKFIFQQIIANFPDFWQNNSLFMKKNHAFKKYQPQKGLFVDN